MGRNEMKRTWVLMGILALATALRFANLGGRPIWYDEAFAVLYAGRSLSEILHGTLARVQGVAADVHPVLYYFLLHGWMRLAGQTPVAVRMPSVLLGLGTVMGAWGLARELFDDRVALLAAAFTAGSPFLIAYSQETRMYALLGFWTVAALWAFLRATRKGRLGAWAAFTVCGALALYSHNLGFLTFAGLGLFVIAHAIAASFLPHKEGGGVEQRRRWALAGKTALAGLGMALLFAPWLALVPSQFGKVEQSYWVTRPDFKALVQTLIVFSFDFENAIFPSGLIAPALFGVLLLLVVVIVQLFRYHAPRDHPVRFGAWLLATLAFAPVAALFLISQWRPVYVIRGLLPAAVCYLILAAWAVAQMPRVARYGLLAILVLLAGATLTSYYSYRDFPRGPFAQLAVALRDQLRPGDVILHSNKLTFFPMYYYDRALPQEFLGDPPGSGSDTLAYPTQQALGFYSTTLDAATGKAQRVWLVIFRQAMIEVEGVHPHVAWLEAHWTRAQAFSMGNMDVILFVPRGY